MKNILTFIFLAFNALVFSQLTIDSLLTPQQLVENILAGSGVVVSNVTFNGAPGNILSNQCGTFNGASSNLGLNSGVILTSGAIRAAIGPNDEIGATEGIYGPANDIDLNQISTEDLSDQAVLEFDFIPVGETVTFKYVFASEEYNEYVCSDYNDVFGFFISGPGINGPFTNNGENIAIIPGTTTPVAINTINNGTPGPGYPGETCGAIDPNWQAYSIYFNNNLQQSIQYDGMTVVLTASSPVQCGETYHIKMAIADAFDATYDSGVFLQAGSLNSVGLDINLSTVTGDTIIYETCTPAEFVFIRPQSQLNDTTVVHYILEGTAVENLDYSNLNDSVVFLPNEDTVYISLLAFQDGIVEGFENMILTATLISECGDTIIKSKSLTISDEPLFDVIVNNPIVSCPDDSVTMSAEAFGGTPPYTYTWSNGEIGSSVFGAINGPGTQTYIVNILDFCGFSFKDSVTITQSPSPIINILANDITIFCPNPNLPISAIASNGYAPYTYTWDNGQNGATITIPVLENGTNNIMVTATDVCGNQANKNITISLNKTLEIDSLNQISSNFCSPTGMASAFVSGITGTPTFLWKGPGINGPTVGNNLAIQNLSPGEYFFVVSDQVCADTSSIIVQVLDTIIPQFSTNTITSEIPLNLTLFNSSLNATSYDWDFGNGEQELNVDISNQNPTYSEPNTYTITLFAYQGPCVDSMKITFTILPKPSVYLPNIFTPNGDNLNDEFTLAPMYFEKFDLVILNRWGNVIFESTDTTKNWNGLTQNGNEAEPGAYFYIYSGIGINKQELEGQGFFQLVRK